MSVLLLGLGVGAVGAIFSIVDVAFLRPLPYPEPDRLLWVSTVQPGPNGGETKAGLVKAQLAQWRNSGTVFEAIEGAQPTSHTVLIGSEAEPANGLQTSAGLLPLLGGTPVRGRGFSRDDEIVGNANAIISYAFWQRHLASDANVIGRALNVDGVPRVIIGVLPDGFAPFFVPTDIFTPLSLDATQLQNTWRGIISVGRLRNGIPPSRVAAELDRTTEDISASMPSLRGTHARFRPIRDVLFGGDRGSLLVAFSAVVLLLLLAVANIMNLSLSDGLARRTATMTRVALGASRMSIGGQRFAEACILAVVASGIGLALCRLTIVGMQSVNPGFFSGYGTLEMDARVIAASLVAAFLGAFIAAVPVAIAESRVSIASMASAASRGLGSRRERWTRESLLAGQVSIALVLLFAASLLTKNLRSMMATRRGFESAGLLAVRISIPPRYSTPEARSAYLEQLITALRNVPGVAAASAAQVSFATGSTAKSVLAVEGVPSSPGVNLVANMRHVMPGLLEVMRIKLVSGRGFEETDREGGRPVALVSASFAKQFLPAGRALGSRVRRTAIEGAPWMDVVGVVDEVKDAGVAEDIGPTIYVPYRQDNQTTVGMTLIARLSSPIPPSERAVKTAISTVDRSQAVTRVALIDDLAYESAAAQRFQALIVALFAAAAVSLVAGGIYALTLFTVLKRTREIGLRSALGGEPSAMVWNSI